MGVRGRSEGGDHPLTYVRVRIRNLYISDAGMLKGNTPRVGMGSVTVTFYVICVKGGRALQCTLRTRTVRSTVLYLWRDFMREA